MTKEISDKIKLLGLIMTCAIVWYHSPSVYDAYVTGSLDESANMLVNYWAGVLGALAMCHFFTVTGFLLFQNYSLRTYPEKIKRRVFSLLIPYILWQCITVVLKLLTGDTVTAWDFVRKTFLFERFPYNGALWYVYAVFFMALLSPVLLLLFRNRTVGWCSIMVFIVLDATKYSFSAPAIVAALNYSVLENILFYLPAFLMGCFYGSFSAQENNVHAFKYIVATLFVTLMLEFFFPGYFRDLTINLIPIMLLYTMPSVSWVSGKKIFQLTFLTYAIHQPLILSVWAVLSRLFNLIPLPAVVCNLMTRTITVAVMLCLAWVIHAVLQRLSPRLLRALTGGRH